MLHPLLSCTLVDGCFYLCSSSNISARFSSMVKGGSGASKHVNRSHASVSQVVNNACYDLQNFGHVMTKANKRLRTEDEANPQTKTKSSSTITCTRCRDDTTTYFHKDDGKYVCFGCWCSEDSNALSSVQDRILAWNTMRENGELFDRTGVVSRSYPYSSAVKKS